MVAPARFRSGFHSRVSLGSRSVISPGGPGLRAIPPVLLDKDATGWLWVCENT